ncbi:prolinerich protein [Striga asiatica]|uniref:Prolinerich protein n=1 Tax=Striga asiatica TaxID=4170 RepID=A0A5A7PSS7_STRAF|nr:prolinerich protein [Striga asiatica]
MRVHTLITFFLLLLFCAVSICNANGQTFEVVGAAECVDCKENKFNPSQAFSGLRVTIDCKLESGKIKRVGEAVELDEQGQFRVSLPKDIVVQNRQKLRDKCYAQLHSSAAIPCPAHDGLEAAKIAFESKTDKGSTFVPAKNLRFSSALCTSKFLWPHYHKHPPLSKSHFIWKKKFPKIKFPPLKNFVPPFPPLYKPKPSIPIYKPPTVPISKPKPPTVPIYKPKPPVYKPKPKPKPKPLPPTAPVYKPKPKPKPLPPTAPVYKPKPKPKPLPTPAPVYKPKPPVYKPPIVIKPLPPPIPLFPHPPFYKKPCPPFPKVPKKDYHHPKFGYYFPPLPPSIPQP